jgi:peptidyl-prolyl cis-trans isomerase SurA
VRKLTFLFFILVSLALPAWAAERHDGIAAVVNNQAITRADVNDRMKLIMISSGLPNTPEMIAKVGPQVINALIEETAKNKRQAG